MSSRETDLFFPEIEKTKEEQVWGKPAVVDLDNSYFLQSWKYFVVHNILLSNVKRKIRIEKEGRERQRDRGNERGE